MNAGPGSTTDIVLSIVLIILTGGLFVFVITSLLRYLRQEYYTLLRRLSKMHSQSSSALPPSPSLRALHSPSSVAISAVSVDSGDSGAAEQTSQDTDAAAADADTRTDTQTDTRTETDTDAATETGTSTEAVEMTSVGSD